MTQVTWVLESDVFPDSHPPVRDAIRSAGHCLVDWQDTWWDVGLPSSISECPTLFHGSLGNASEIAEKLSWRPGSFCNTSAFHCSAWYESAREWLLHAEWRFLAANEFVATAAAVCEEVGCSDRVFVRPDSPLKPFSGRVLDVDSITLASLDHGFYFDDETLPIMVAPIRDVGREWRFVIVHSTVIAGSGYDAESRSAIVEDSQTAAWSFANSVASSIPAPADVYVLDVCESDSDFRLLELNPFGGADLYACDAPSVVEAVSEAALGV